MTAPQICNRLAGAEAGHVKHMADGGGCKVGDAVEAKNQFFYQLGINALRSC
jgi:hypothetical protein